MAAFGAAGLNSAHAGELVELSAAELRQVDGGVSPLLALSKVVGPITKAGSNAAIGAAKTGGAGWGQAALCRWMARSRRCKLFG